MFHEVIFRQPTLPVVLTPSITVVRVHLEQSKVDSGLYHETSHRQCFARSARLLQIDAAYERRLIDTNTLVRITPNF